MTGKTREAGEAVENAAWGGANQREREAIRPRKPFVAYELVGHLPDGVRIATGAGAILFGILLAVIVNYSLFPEMNNLQHADTCQSDCTWSKGIVGILIIVGGIAAIVSLLYGGVTLIGGLGFDENRLRVRMREVSV